MTDKLAEARKLERDAIVAWLRKGSQGLGRVANLPFVQADETALVATKASAEQMAVAADAIERGDHLAA